MVVTSRSIRNPCEGASGKAETKAAEPTYLLSQVPDEAG
jgi:hypothetical protein